MTVIVTDSGFAADDGTQGYVPADETTNDVVSLDVASDMDPAELIQQLSGVEMIRVDFPSFANGRGFTIARQLRLAGLDPDNAQ